MTEYCDWCHTSGHPDAFKQLLAVAKAGEEIYGADDVWIRTEDPQAIAEKCARDTAFGDALDALDAAHPDWRKWV